MKKNNDYEKNTVIPFADSLKFRFGMISVAIFLIFGIIISLSLYSFFTYFKQNNYYTTEYYKIVELRDNFLTMNDATENYLITGSETQLEIFNSCKAEISNTISELHADSTSYKSEEHNAIIHAVTSSTKNYLTSISNLILSSEKEEALTKYYDYYQSKSSYIINYYETLLNIKSVSSQAYFQRTENEMYMIFIAEICVFILLIFLLIYNLILIFKKTINPITKLSSYLVEISLENFDIEDINIDNSKNKDEISLMMMLFNNVKHNLKEKIEYYKASIDANEKLIEEQKKYREVKQLLIDNQEQNAILFKKANYDNLTQIFNRQAFESNVQKTLSEFSDSDLGALLVIDVDNFKSVNDTLGHQGGDAVLKSLALCLTNTLAECGFAGRWGGDEFVGFISNAPDIHFIRTKTANLCSLMNRQFMFKGIIHHISISIGVCPMKSNDLLSEAYERADLMLYDVKKMGRNNYKLYLNSDSSHEFKEAVND